MFRASVAVALGLLMISVVPPLPMVQADPDQDLLFGDPGYPGPASVVAVIDTGVNPFHEAFRRPDLMAPGTFPVEAIDATTGAAPLYIPIEPISDPSEGAWLDDLLEPRTLYRFAGTNLLYYSMMDPFEEVDYSGHGTGTAGTVVANAPDVLIVMVQTDGHPLDSAVAWAAAQPWIDVVSISWGCPDDCFWPYLHTVAGLAPRPYGDDVANETLKAWDSGKLVVNSAGNDGTTHWTDDDGAPWVIAVGGANASSGTSTYGSRQAPDLISDYEVIVPDEKTVNGTKRSRGTSFSAPTVAATLAESIRQARVATGHHGGISNGLLVDAGGYALDNGDFRYAMNRSAEYWTYPGPNLLVADTSRPEFPDRVDPFVTPRGCTPYCPEPVPRPPVPVPSSKQPVNPVAPWLEMGWGYLNGTHAPALRAALIDDQWPPEKPEAAKTHMEHRQEVRAALWPQPGPVLDPETMGPVGRPLWDLCHDRLDALILLPYGSPCPIVEH